VAKTAEKKFNVQIDHGSYWARIVVPADVRGIIGRWEYLENLGRVDTTPYDVAVAKCCEYKLEWRANIKAARAGTYVAPDAPQPIFSHIHAPGFYQERIETEIDGRLITGHVSFPGRIPAYTPPAPIMENAVVTFESMIAEWVSKKRIDNPSTLGKVTGQFERFATFLGHNDGKKVIPQKIVEFERHLETTPDPRTKKARHPNTIANYLNNIKGVFNVAVQRFLLTENPMDNVSIGSKVDSTRKAYTVEQVTTILQGAQKESYDIFLPLLVQSYSGMRVAEIADCSTRDFNFVRDNDQETVTPGQWHLYIGEDNREPGQTTKGHRRRYVPLHPEVTKHLIPYVESVRAQHGDGPLFPLLPKDKHGKRSTYVARKIDDWMDGIVKDPNLAPNHSFRHYLKTRLLACGVDVRVSDSITGHKTVGVGRGYEYVEMTKKFEAVSTLPVIPLA
jgi:integrase